MNVTKGEYKDRQPQKEGYLQKVSAEQREYAEAFAHQKITENNITDTDLSTDDLLEKILDKDNLNIAFKKVKSNKGARGIDGMEVDELLPYLRENQKQLLQSIRDGKYRLNPVRRVEIPKEEKGKVRKLGIPTVVDRVIQQAISENRQISFKYFEYTIVKKKQLRNSGQLYVVSPYALSWVDENYYLISHYPKNPELTHFRVDRMTEIKLLEEPRRALAEIIGEQNLDIAEYSKKVFNMFGGEEEAVKLQLDNSLINVVIDRFGKDVNIEKVDENSFAVRTNVAVSSTFLAWVFQFGNKVKILSPESVVKRYKENLREIMKQY